MKKSKAKAKKRPAAKSQFKVQPLGDKIIVKELAKEEGTKTASGIIIPPTVSEDKSSKSGKVVAVGDGRTEDGRKVPIGVSVGDKVLFQWGDRIEVDGDEYFVVSEPNVIGVIK